MVQDEKPEYSRAWRKIRTCSDECSQGSYFLPDITLYISSSSLTHCICISELGDGWAPAVLDNEQEFNFVLLSVKHVLPFPAAFIAGRIHPETIIEEFGFNRYSYHFSYPNYSPTQGGKEFSILRNLDLL